MENQITHVAWLNAGCVGVVRVETFVDDNKNLYEEKFYIKGIGLRNIGSGRTEKSDAADVATFGHRLDNDLGKQLIERYGYPYVLSL